MKKVLLVVIMFLMFAGVITASSINGDYKGKPIVKLKSNGQVLAVEDAPAVIMDSRTMVPISMLRQIGLGVEWNAEEYSVDVTLPTPNNDESDLKAQIKTMESNALLADMYTQMMELYDEVLSLSSTFNDVYGYILNDFEHNISLTERFDFAIKKYNSVKEYVSDSTEKTDNQLYDYEFIELAMTDIQSAIDTDLRAALINLLDFEKTQTQEISDDFFNNLGLSSEKVYKHKLNIYKQYKTHINKVITSQ
jgi:hypothetical protein